MMDLLAFSSLLFLLYVQVQATHVDQEATREKYDRKMREYVLSHDLMQVKEEAIDVRRHFRNAERKRQHDAQLSLGILAFLGVYLLYRLFWVRM